jgi:hypothetical protein
METKMVSFVSDKITTYGLCVKRCDCFIRAKAFQCKEGVVGTGKAPKVLDIVMHIRKLVLSKKSQVGRLRPVSAGCKALHAGVIPHILHDAVGVLLENQYAEQSRRIDQAVEKWWSNPGLAGIEANWDGKQLTWKFKPLDEFVKLLPVRIH